ncbi:hypothetical protein [Mucilaginibacter psychrotolerans]|uniref:Uncharacterized protein n=1 Tax=Mucilaginibacter psychrotolerans TaxID=1524096 RepID=A0A4Y8SH86_9SPHI|nr:hypothetical protein [Mucilaginibacter psychrotolerans]TFF38409.1 hypothetical protein E2R66_08035 [Mucilaginibacter psychrotolerans]
MKKVLSVILLFMLACFFAQAQSLTDDQKWDSLISSLEAEDWMPANQLSLSLLNSIPAAEQNGNQAAMLRYMYILSESGLMDLGKVDKPEALKKVIGFVGKPIMLPGHPVSVKQGFNSITSTSNGADTLFVTAANKKATSIFAFEYIVLKQKWTDADLNANAGKIWRLGGILKSINVEGNMFKRFKLLIDEGTAEEQQP